MQIPRAYESKGPTKISEDLFLIIYFFKLKGPTKIKYKK